MKGKKIHHSKPFVSKQDIEAVNEVVKSRMHSTGKKTKEFENAMCRLIGVKYGKATNSGTSALHLALMALDIGKQDEVIIPSYVCQSVLSAVNYTNAKPVLADIDSDFEKNGYNISAKTIKPLITKKTKAIIVPHMFGFPADINKIKKTSKKIPIIEDCAQCIGGKYKGKMLGSFGDMSIFSFYATKVISSGSGGMVLTNSKKLKEKFGDLTRYDKRERYEIAYNYSLSDINSALGLSQLKKLKKFIKRRHEIAKKYNKNFRQFPKPLFPIGSFPFRYIIHLKNEKQRDKFQRELMEKNIVTDKPVFKPLHQYLKLKDSEFKNSIHDHKTTVSISLYPALTDEEVDFVIKSVLEFFHLER